MPRPAPGPQRAVPASPSTEIGQTQHSGTGVGTPVLSPLERSNQALLRQLDPNDPKYRGPGWIRGTDKDGAVTLIRSGDPAMIQAQNEWELNQSNPQPPVPTTNDVPGQTDFTQQSRPQYDIPVSIGSQGYVNLGGQAVATSGGQQVNPGLFPTDISREDIDRVFAPGSQDQADGSAEVDRAKIDQLLGNVSKATSGLAGLAESEDKYSEAQAQLALGTAQAQQNALALARSGNRRDAAALGARALQTNAELGAEATRSAALLRAQEEDQNRRLRLDAYKAAGDLGLNTAALELDVSRLNMDAATNWLNQQFENYRLGLQLNQQEAERVTNFVRDMALIEKDYHALSLAERQSLRDDLTRRYGIDEQTRVALKQIEESGMSWTEFGQQFLLGAAQGGSAALATKALASDRRAKTNIKDTTDEELEELLNAVKSKTYDYKDPARHGPGRQFGAMAQDLKRSKLGSGMVEKAESGTLMVDGAKAGMAALSAVALVYDKLKQLEAAL